MTVSPFPRSARIVLLALAALLLHGCSTWRDYAPDVSRLGVYKLDINQGNYITQDMVEKLKEGQNKQQVRLILGTPLLVSAFRDNRWDYLYEYTRQGKKIEHRKFSAYFVDDKLARWEGDELPVSAAQLNRIAADRALAPQPGAEREGTVGAFPRRAEGQLVSVAIAIAGAGGRMGQALIEATLAQSDLALAAALDVAQSPLVGRDAGERIGHHTGITVTTDVAEALARSDVLIDFTRPEGTLEHAAACAKHGVAFVAGTTGLSATQKAALAAHGQSIAIVFAPNMSVGVNVLVKLVELATSRLGSAYDVEIVEMHHKHKVDAPSGTALLLGEAAAKAKGTTLAECAIYAREGATGERKPGAIGFAALRGGDVVGEHTVIYAADGERVELTHRATSRQTFAGGALRAARFVAARRAAGEAGLYDMADVLDLK